LISKSFASFFQSYRWCIILLADIRNFGIILLTRYFPVKTKLSATVAVIAYSLALLGTSQGQQPQCVSAPPGLVGWWAGDSNFNDYTTNGNNGGGVGISFETGKVDGAFQFDGTSSAVLINGSPELNVKSLTFNAWIYPTDVSLRPIIEYGDENDYAGAHFWIGSQAGAAAPGSLYANFRIAPFQEYPIEAPAVIVPNVWSFVSATYDQGTGVGKLYVNGQLVKEQTLGVFNPRTNKRLNIGQRTITCFDGSNGRHFEGKIDEAQVFNRALNQTEINDIYAAGPSGLCKPVVEPPPSTECVSVPPGLVGWWSGDNHARDLSTNQNDATLLASTGYEAAKVASGFSFNGSSSAATIPSSPSLTVESLTFGAWIFPTDVNLRPILEYGDENDWAGAHFWVGSQAYSALPGALYANFREGPFQNHVIQASDVIAGSTWSFVSATYDKSSGIARLYVNGQMVQEENLGIFTPRTDKRLNIGQRTITCFDGSNGSHFTGIIDEVQVFNRPLTQSEIKSIYDAGPSGVCKEETPVLLQQPTGTFSQSEGADLSVSKMIDGVTTDNLGWSVYPNIQAQTAAFETRDNIGFPGGTVLTFNLVFNHHSVPGSTSHTLGRFRLAATTDPRDTFADGLQSGGDVSANWHILGVLSAISRKGATLTVQPDGSILASGTLAEEDVYTIRTVTRDTGLTGIRLEALTDASLPHNGPGREPLNGNFVVSEMLIFARSGGVPLITDQPDSLSVDVGASASFNVSASSSLPITYQWSLNGAAIAGATNASYSIENAQFANAGTYTVQAANAEGVTISAPAVLNVIPADSTNAASLFVSNEVPTNAPISDMNLVLLSGARYLAQVYAGTSTETLAPASPAVPFLTGEDAGYFTPIDLLLPGVTPGDSVKVQVRVWDSAAGASYEQAVANAGQRGSSEILDSVTGGGSLPTPQLQGLTSFSLVAPPKIIQQPLGKALFVGEDVTFSVQASGSAPLSYQWRFGTNELTGATTSSLTLTNVQVDQSGEYSVVISNPLGSAASSAALLTVNVPDVTPPAITLTSPTNGVVFEDRVTLSGTISDNIGVASALWERNGQPGGNLLLEDGHFIVRNVVLSRGTNTFRVTATDTSSNEASASVTVTLEASRTLAVGEVETVQEGARLKVPLLLATRGDVAGLNFVLKYDKNALADPEFDWGNLPNGAFTQVNSSTGGVISASLALPGTALNSGTQKLAQVLFRTRSIPQTLDTQLKLSDVGVYSATGDPLITGTDILSGSAHITKRKYIGDNNANDRLDVNDASFIMRLITRVEVPRPWDTAANDLNKNSLLDSGDVIKVLRAVVGLDQQPGGGQSPQSLRSSSIHTLALNGATVSLTADKQRAIPGEKVKVTVNLTQMQGSLSGVSFKLSYPVGALKLDDATAYRIGVIVPAAASSVWNLSPTNNYAEQDGSVRLAATSAANWPTNSGVLAEFTFTVQTAETGQYRWPITISNVELSSGYDLVTANDASISFIGRDPVPPKFEGGLNLTNGQFQISMSGEAGVHYLIEFSDDLETWTELTTLVVAAGGQIQATDSAAAEKDHRFYRATQLN
jgi:hypothetical protein